VTGIERQYDAESRSPPRADAAIARLASKQHGVVARRQLVALGVGRTAIQRRVAAERLHVVHRGVYAVGHVRLPPLGRWMAAVLACGGAAVLSHLCAAALWDLLRYGGARAHVTVPRGRGGPAAIAVHETRRLAAADRAVRDGIPVTSVPRTLLDLAESVPPARLEQAVEQADRLRLLDVRALAELERRATGRRGLTALRALLADLRPASDTRSQLERLFLAVVSDARLPPPATNAASRGTSSTPSGRARSSSWSSTATPSTPPARRSSKTASATPTSSLPATG
jgi:hypothetical protein